MYNVCVQVQWQAYIQYYLAMAVATGWAGEVTASPLFWNSVSLIATWPHHNFKSNSGYPLVLYVSTIAGFAAYMSNVNLHT